ncbi:EAL domain-containing protein [Alteromonas pelagimontana]|uniref:EAL domain-containing protein n=2 Tax=Alteromonas pelagimontana TaxID=1858656 RepID=A0A6N3IVX0_9ALTE|nr:EAL domain-containing protein [Alteromonas pelagimontana]
MTALAMSGLVFGFDSPNTQHNKLAFWYVMMIVLVIRLIDAAIWYIRSQKTDYDPQTYLIRFSTGVVVTALVWSSYSIVLYSTMATLELASTMIILSAMAGGAATILAPSRTLVWLYCSILLIPMSVLAIFDQREEFLILGSLGLMFWVAMLITSLRSNRFFSDAIELKARNVELMKQMAAEKGVIQRINDELHRTNEKLDATNATLEEEVIKRTEELHRLSSRDPLTSLMNRSGFLRHLDRLLETAKKTNSRLAVLFIDLDGFKQVNDSLGHRVGDEVLVEVAQRLTRFCEADCLARWGGDEFIMILPYANRDTAIAVAQAARSGVTLPFNVAENQITLDATIGISLFPEHGELAPILIQDADLTMYQQKRTSRGSVGVFNAAIYESLKEEQALHEGLRQAIAKREFTLVYQPLVTSEDEKLWAVEALLRWQFGGRAIGPDVFIPLAEKCGLIHEIGIWVLHRACIDAAQWQFDEPVAVSVNVSVIQLMADGFIKILDRALASSGLNPERLHLEITESVFAKNKEKVIREVNAIKARKVQISIDDFGTGFSSLSQLQSLNFDHIKIDRTFVQNLEEGSDTIIRATVLIAREFGCKTIAEGIETPEHAAHLKAMGVDYLQGYYYAKPLSLTDLLHWYNNNNR